MNWGRGTLPWAVLPLPQNSQDLAHTRQAWRATRRSRGRYVWPPWTCGVPGPEGRLVLSRNGHHGASSHSDAAGSRVDSRRGFSLSLVPALKAQFPDDGSSEQVRVLRRDGTWRTGPPEAPASDSDPGGRTSCRGKFRGPSPRERQLHCVTRRRSTAWRRADLQGLLRVLGAENPAVRKVSLPSPPTRSGGSHEPGVASSLPPKAENKGAGLSVHVLSPASPSCTSGLSILHN